MMLMSWVELHSIFEWNCWWKGWEGIRWSRWHYFQRSLGGLSIPWCPSSPSRFYGVDLSLRSARSFAWHWSSSSNSLVALLLAGSDAAGLLTPLWRANTLDSWHKSSFSCLDKDSSMAGVIFFDILDWEICQRQGTNGCWHLDCWTWSTNIVCCC